MGFVNIRIYFLVPENIEPADAVSQYNGVGHDRLSLFPYFHSDLFKRQSNQKGKGVYAYDEQNAKSPMKMPIYTEINPKSNSTKHPDTGEGHFSTHGCSVTPITVHEIESDGSREK